MPRDMADTYDRVMQCMMYVMCDRQHMRSGQLSAALKLVDEALEIFGDHLLSMISAQH